LGPEEAHYVTYSQNLCLNESVHGGRGSGRSKDSPFGLKN
jgi:hypothetical protein